MIYAILLGKGLKLQMTVSICDLLLRNTTGNKSKGGGDMFLIKYELIVQAIFSQYNHSGHSYLEAVELL